MFLFSLQLHLCWLCNQLCIYIWLMRTWFWLTFVFVDLSLNRLIEALVQAVGELYKGLKIVMLAQLFVSPPLECHAVIVTLSPAHRLDE